MEPLPKKNETHRDDDRLSSLPDAILHHILSLSGFQIFDVVKLGVLSKRWNHLWITMPYFDIHIQDFHKALFRGVSRDHTFAEQLISFINWVLIRQGQSSLVRFRLLSRENIHEVQILRWLRLVVERNVQELDIKFSILLRFRLPLFIAVNDSLRLLKITSVIHMQLPSVIRLNQLRSLELKNVSFSDSAMLQQLFSGCCSLESFRLNDCKLDSFGFLDFSSTHLKELVVCFLDGHMDFSNFEIKVSCPNLINFKYSGRVAINYILEDVSSLETAWINFVQIVAQDDHAGHAAHSILKEVHNVTNLNCNMFVVSSLSYVIDEWIRCPTSFLKLKFLSMNIATINYETRVMFHFLDHCPNLEVLTLVSDEAERYGDDQHWELQCEGIVSWKSHPHLKAIKFVNFIGEDYEIDFLRFLFKNAKSLERMDIILCRGHDISVEEIDEVMMFPKASSEIVVTFKDLT